MSAFQVNDSPHAYIASSLRERTSTVHPHACGEHAGLAGKLGVAGGSSPRMWGTRQHQVGSLRHSPVHPHACGEHAAQGNIGPMIAGSSPRMWGTRARKRPGDTSRRFIPTHVGNT